MAFTGIAALVAGEAVTTALVLSVATEVGIAMTVVGAATGSKDLMKIGGILGLVGGVGGLVNGAVNSAASAAADAAASAGADAASSALSDTAMTSAMGDSLMQTPGLNAIEAGTSTGDLFAGAGGKFGDTASLISPTATAPSVAAATSLPATAAPAAVVDAPSSISTMASSEGSLNNAADTSARLGQSTDIGGSYDSYFNKGLGNYDVLGAGGGAGAAQDPNSWWARWNKLGDGTRTAIIKGGAGLLEGAAKGSAIDTQNQLYRDKLAQTSYGNQVPTGIVNRRLATP